MASHPPHADHEPLRQRPEMASCKLLVLKFVRQYIADWAGSPSLGEIAHALGTNRTRVRRAIKRLEADGQLVRVPGPRGLSLPEEEPLAVRQLRARGWTINPGDRTATAPGSGPPSVTKEPLLPPAELDYPPASIPSRGSGDYGEKGPKQHDKEPGGGGPG